MLVTKKKRIPREKETITYLIFPICLPLSNCCALRDCEEGIYDFSGFLFYTIPL